MLKKLVLFCSLFTIAGLTAQQTSVDIDIVMMIEHNEAESFRHELEVGLNPNACLDDLSLLMIAAQLGRAEIVRDLLARDTIDMHAQDQFGNTALHFAVIFGHTEVVKLLLYADTPRDCACKSRLHRRFVHQMPNNEGKTPADLAHSAHLEQMLKNPDAYINAHPQEFREVVRWFDTMCPIKARARSYRGMSWSDKISAAAKKTGSALAVAYQKTKEVAAKGYEVGKKAKDKVGSKYQKAKAFFSKRYDKAKDKAAAGYEKSKEVAAAGYEKTKSAMSSAYQKAKAKITPSGN